MTTHDDRPGAARIATISALIVVATFVAGKAARDAILLSHFSIRYLPLFIGIAAVLSFPVILIAGRLMSRFGPARLVPVLNVVSAGFAIGEWLLLGSYPRVIAVMVFIHLSTASAVLVSGFWSIVNERFDVQTAKRHIGRVGMGATLGGILGGVVAERTAVYLQPDMILLVLAGLQVVCAGALFVFGRGAKLDAVEPPSEGTWTALRHAAKAPLFRNVGVIVVLGAVAAGLIDYVFKADIVAVSSQHELLRSLAVFHTITNILTAVVQVSVCGPIIARIGVPRSVATLPATITAFSLVALVLPIPMSAAFARAAELVTRNSVYRSSYELLYAPLPEERKRPTKVVLDVGADKIGDILGAQLVGLIVFVAIDVRAMLLLAAVITGVLALFVAMRLPSSYTKALEESLLHAAEAASIEPPPHAAAEPWLSLSGLPTFGSPDAVPLRMRPRASRRKVAPPPPAPLSDGGHPGAHDPVVTMVADLRSTDVARVRHALSGPISTEIAAHVIDLVGRDDVGREAADALGLIAGACTGLLADALLDDQRAVAVRRRIPAILMSGEPRMAAWALWKGLSDPDFDVRYRAGAALAKLAAGGHLAFVSEEEVFEAVRRELVADPVEWKGRTLVEDAIAAAHPADEEVRVPSSLEHVFRVLGLVLPAEPLRIALHAMQVDDPALRGTALEYLESILPTDVRAQLWPLLDTDEPAITEAVASAVAAAIPANEHETSDALRPPSRSMDELLAELSGAYPAVVSHLKQRRKPA